MNILDVTDLQKSYGRFNAVDHVSFTMREGEFLTLLGPSGSGKTTTLQMIAGLTQPSGGSINLAGRPVHPLPPHKRDIGVVFQNYALFPHMTAFDNVAFPLRARRIPEATLKKRVDEVLEIVGLPGLGGRYPMQMSGGQQQRVALARAMVFRPRLLLMDEPLGALDKNLREQIQLEIMRLHRELGMSIIYVTHDQEEALVMSDRIAVFNKGRIEQLDAPQELYEKPRTLFIAGFIGDSNFLPVSVGRDKMLSYADRPLRAQLPAPLEAGGTATLVIRPERIRISSRTESASTSENVISGHIKTVIYLGKSRKYVIVDDRGHEILALEQCHEAARGGLSEGTPIFACWQAEESIVLKSA